MNETLTAKWNRLVSDVRCAIGGRLIAAGARITDASVHDRLGEWTWKRACR